MWPEDHAGTVTLASLGSRSLARKPHRRARAVRAGEVERTTRKLSRDLPAGRLAFNAVARAATLGPGGPPPWPLRTGQICAQPMGLLGRYEWPEAISKAVFTHPGALVS